MIGNDVVDLRKAGLESNWKRKGYLAKICTPEEQQMILEASNPTVVLWLIWTMKEAACKIIQRKTGIRNYVPLHFHCEDLPCYNEHLKQGSPMLTGKLSYFGDDSLFREDFHIKSEINASLIHSIAVSNISHFEELHLQYLRPAINYREEFNNLSKLYLLASTPSGLPELVHQITGQKHAVSVSHHGDYLAIVYSDSLLLTD
ncbi:4-phosphopantetheinyl transferase family protein [Pedobacter sp. PAMC26386]|nr:4-phosphopantetheinyl transferase family protein [Pedobacter sp. PAMC26386]